MLATPCFQAQVLLASVLVWRVEVCAGWADPPPIIVILGFDLDQSPSI